MIEALLQAERLLAHGMVDQAERVYSSALEQDPRNAIAVVGLARVALERGDDQLAYDRAREALEIDPQNAAALRLEARLAEVFAERGASAEAAASASATASAAQTPAEPVSADDALPSEKHVFSHNPSMSDHRRMEELRQEPPTTGSAATAEASRPSLLRRLFGE